MNTIKKWIILGSIEILFCFWLLGTSANLVSAPNTAKVWLGVFGYCSSLVFIPALSILQIQSEIADAKRRQRELKAAFPYESFSVLELLDKKSTL
ncbi:MULTISPECIES: hypothetical protein [unclassified Roseofilum]|uniref:hypothetical protein n=1 Tax=unclassified Roseofilum TaxID=2620099 RepID=UPI001B03FEBB|nr:MULTISPECIES: hypothetical protein [unclassified Roseofilum]MBP0011173.1 hypothetical protein [Roseofilum sp. Belize Diploria]MBP0015204.1 hypothetical protein [Roseofilum sp. SID3]MBP0024480.1 hypothetical protein [Roseofilum sp. SID2]MBP0035838.1 hypothetical protein [Roseofilum sp. Belize BBD 4]MBP0038757.1 hypothetical protein [Roseofilum sp. SID1]